MAAIRAQLGKALRAASTARSMSAFLRFGDLGDQRVVVRVQDRDPRTRLRVDELAVDEELVLNHLKCMRREG